MIDDRKNVFGDEPSFASECDFIEIDLINLSILSIAMDFVSSR